jgi:hypothetical protein
MNGRRHEGAEAWRHEGRALRVSGIACCILFFAPFCLAASGKGLGSLDDNALYSELADRGLDDLLQRAMDSDGVAPDQRMAIASMS